jgi:hypothetical protein
MQNQTPKIINLSCRSFSEGGSSFGNQIKPSRLSALRELSGYSTSKNPAFHPLNPSLKLSPSKTLAPFVA